VTAPDLPHGDLRDALSALVPEDLAPPLEFIDRRAAHLRRRTYMRAGAMVAAAVVVVVALVSGLAPGARGTSVRVEGRKTPRHHRTAATATTTPPLVTTTSIGSNGSTPAPTTPVTHKTDLTVPPPQPQPGPTPTYAPAPTTVPPVTAPPASAPATTTPTTSVPTTVPPAREIVRLELILDDAGLHAPATFVARDLMEITFRDNRTVKSPSAYMRIDLPSPQPSQAIRPWYDEDMFAHFGAIATFDHHVGDLNFQAIDRDTKADIPGCSASVSISLK
jgi:hypothetical protein